ncbi:hypothetical protein [Pseudomonas sp. DSP3-2-2]|uniref:hypothetical protein n=1 Tax=unclassified Pseudomonas TaxID=196821 RepID=UPI003CF9C7D3
MTNEAAYERIKHMIGNPYHPCVKGYISCLTGRTSVAGPDSVMFIPAFDSSSESFEYDPQRITIDTDEQGMILDFLIG